MSGFQAGKRRKTGVARITGPLNHLEVFSVTDEGLATTRGDATTMPLYPPHPICTSVIRIAIGNENTEPDVWKTGYVLPNTAPANYGQVVP